MIYLEVICAVTCVGCTIFLHYIARGMSQDMEELADLLRDDKR